MLTKIKAIAKNFDEGVFLAAKTHADGPMTYSGFMTDQLIRGGIDAPTEEQIQKRVSKLLGKLRFTEAAAMDMPEAFRESLDKYVMDTWGLEKLLQAEDIRIKGGSADRIEKFFGTSTSPVLFPVYLESQIVMGILQTSILSQLIATETNIDSHTYDSLAFTDVAADQQMGLGGEGADLKTVKITTADRSIKLKKYGVYLEATYESIRLSRINVFGLHLQRIGQRLALDECDDAIETLIAGDGNTSSAMSGTDGSSGILQSEVTTTLDYDELVRLFGTFTPGYQMTSCICPWTFLRTILNMSEFKDPLAGFNFQRTGVLPGPMGATWNRWDSTGSSSYSTDRILAVDGRRALEQVTEQGIMLETEKIIRKQLQGSAITKWTGWAKLDYAASKVLDVTHA
jgi:hypothetical protein